MAEEDGVEVVRSEGAGMDPGAGVPFLAPEWRKDALVGELRVVRASMGLLLMNRGKGSDVREREESTGKEEGAQVRVTA